MQECLINNTNAPVHHDVHVLLSSSGLSLVYTGSFFKFVDHCLKEKVEYTDTSQLQAEEWLGQRVESENVRRLMDINGILPSLS